MRGLKHLLYRIDKRNPANKVNIYDFDCRTGESFDKFIIYVKINTVTVYAFLVKRMGISPRAEDGHPAAYEIFSGAGR